jgi:hypothetical protein
MIIRFLYSVGTMNGMQRHEVQKDIEVPGDGNERGDPSYMQLGKADIAFRSWFLTEYGATGMLIYYVSTPADGTKAGSASSARSWRPTRYSAHQSRLPGMDRCRASATPSGRAQHGSTGW